MTPSRHVCAGRFGLSGGPQITDRISRSQQHGRIVYEV